MHPYRVFVSYSREDKALVERFVAHLRKTGLRAVWDRNISPGQRYSEVIKHDIAHAHVFVPMLTAKSVKRPWVHQETGYAMGCKRPRSQFLYERLHHERLAFEEYATDCCRKTAIHGVKQEIAGLSGRGQ